MLIESGFHWFLLDLIAVFAGCERDFSIVSWEMSSTWGLHTRGY